MRDLGVEAQGAGQRCLNDVDGRESDKAAFSFERERMVMALLFVLMGTH